MTTCTPTYPRERLLRRSRDTTQLSLATDPAVDAAALLDERTLGHTIERDAAAPGHYLAFAGGQRLLPLDDHIIHIGRGLGADLRLDDPRVSRRHAIIVRYGDDVRLLDDQSVNGTFVDGCLVVATDVFDGDLIRVGPVAFSYVRIR